MTSQALLNATSLQELVDGQWRYTLPDGLRAGLFGPVVAPASPSVWPVWAKEPTTSAICGPSSAASLRTADLTQSLGSRLQARLDVNGSPEYKLTWKHWDLPSGLRIFALRASQRRTSDKDYGGWPTPCTPNGGRSPKDGMTTTGVTPDGSKRQVDLQHVARQAGWNTPRATGEELYGSKGKPLSRMAWETGATTGYPVPTEKRGVLNPDLPRWLMQFPVEWLLCAPADSCTGITERARSKDSATP